jgi:flagellar biosynthesis protein FlhF
MQLIPFIAESAADAVAQIRARLGPEAVVVNVRPLPAEGLARLWQKPRIEVLAYRPEAGAPGSMLKESVRAGQSPPPQLLDAITPELPAISLPRRPRGPGAWRAGTILETAGFLPHHAQRVLDQLQNQFGDTPPESLGEEITLVRHALAQFWRQPPPLLEDSLRPHVLVGPAGVGKTTCLCKWLTQTVLLEGRSARVWRLDGRTANGAESLSVYCDILGVPVERMWAINEESGANVSFIDLPGVDWRSAESIRELNLQLKTYLSPRVHLVLNAAYDLPLLLAQVRAFSAMPVEGLILTHLDEETRWGKIWSLVLGTNYTVRFLSTGQNIPGDFRHASAEEIFARQFPE